MIGKKGKRIAELLELLLNVNLGENYFCLYFWKWKFSDGGGGMGQEWWDWGCGRPWE